MATSTELVERFKALTAKLLEQRKWQSDLSQAVVGTTGTARLISVMTADSKQVDEAIRVLKEAFATIDTSVAIDEKARLLPTVTSATLERFDEIASLIESVRNTMLGDQRFHESYHSYAANRPALRASLAAQLVSQVERGQAESERDRRVYRRGFRTSVLVAACGVVLSTLLSYGVQVRRESTDAVSKREERRYQKREALRRALIPKLDSLTSATHAVMTIFFDKPEPPESQSAIALGKLRKAAAGLDSAESLTEHEVFSAFDNSVGNDYGVVQTRAKEYLRQTTTALLDHTKSEQRKARLVASGDSLATLSTQLSQALVFFDR